MQLARPIKVAIFAISLSILFPSSASAVGWSSQKLEVIEVHLNYSGQVIVRRSDGEDWANPDSCDSPSSAVLQPDHPQYDRMFGLLQAGLSGRVRMRFWGCTTTTGTTTKPLIVEVRVTS